MKTITRTISNYTIIADQVRYIDGQMEGIELPVLTTPSKLTETAVIKYFKKLADEGTTIVVKSITKEDKLYSITLEKFMEHAIEITKEEIEEDTEEEITE